MTELDRRGLLALAGAAAMAGGRAWASPTSGGEVYSRAVVIDAMGGFGDPDPDVKESDPPSKQLIDLVRESGVTAVSLTLGDVGNGPDRYLNAVGSLAAVSGSLLAYPEHFMPILRASDLAEAKRSGRLGLIFNLQDTTALDTDLSRVARLRGAGLRILQLTYNKRNLCGDGALERSNGGISDFGRQTIAEINKQKLVLDLSHGGQRTIAEAIAETRASPAITHTGCRSLVDNPRNVFDAELKALADKGGVVGIYFMPFLRPAGTGMARREDLIRHIEHAVKVCGEDHVGIGTDGGINRLVIDDKARENQKKFVEARLAAGIAAPGEAIDVFNIVQEYNEPRRLGVLADDLAARGWPPRRIEKLLGGNFARLFGEVWG